LATIFIIFYRSFHLSQSKKEGFEWSDTSRDNFILVQNTINPNIVFDTKVIQQQATQEEVDFFLNNGFWPWSKEVENLYEEALLINPYIRTYSKNEIERVKTIYNENAILSILASQTKEGQFLLNGVSIKSNSKNNSLKSGWENTSGLVNPTNSVIKCHIDDDDKASLQNITYTDKGGMFSQVTKKINDIDYNDLEKLIPGFTFVKEKCNPCKALNFPAEYSCPFSIDISGNDISPVWKYLWGL
jgi:hypothetical protein